MRHELAVDRIKHLVGEHFQCAVILAYDYEGTGYELWHQNSRLHQNALLRFMEDIQARYAPGAQGGEHDE